MTPERFRIVVSTRAHRRRRQSAPRSSESGFVAALAIGWQGSLIGRRARAHRRQRRTSRTCPAGSRRWSRSRSRQLGLLTLLATPVARVAASVVGFALERDRLYTAITLAVLLILLDQHLRPALTWAERLYPFRAVISSLE